MLFFGTFFDADELTYAPTPTNFGDLEKVQIENGVFDDLYVSKDVTTGVTGEIPTSWDFNTVLHATYVSNLNGGNIDFTFDTVSQIAIKRKRQTDNKWITLYVKDLDPSSSETLQDQLVITGQDLTAAYTNYVYAVVPILNGSEGTYAYAKTIDPDDTSVVYDYTPVKVTELTILDTDAVYHTPVQNGNIDVTSNTSSTAITTLNEKYPTIVRNSRFNYETLSVTGTFLPNEEDDCEMIFDDPIRMSLFNRELKAWLTNPHPKILKDEDGNIWLVYVETGLSDTAYEDNLNELRQLSFTCDEIGNVEDEEALWNAGLIDESVTEEYWNN